MFSNHTNSIDVLPTEDDSLADREHFPALLDLQTAEANPNAPTKEDSGRSVNARFFFLTLGAIFVLMLGVHFLHAYQMQRLSNVFLSNAKQALDEDDKQKAIQYLRQYLTFHPEDLEARILLAKQMAKLAVKPRQVLNVLLVYEGILRADAEQSEIRFEIVELYLRLGQHRDALVHITTLLNKRPSDTKLLLQAAECYEGTGQWDSAAATYRQLIRLTPGDARIYERLAYLLREDLKQSKAADQLIQQLMDSNQRNALAYAVRARYRFRYSELKHAARDARIAYQLDPNDPEVVKLAGMILAEQLKAGQESDFPVVQVRSDLEAFLAKDPEEKTLIRTLVDLDLADGRHDLAEDRLRNYLEIHPRDVMMRFQLADLLLVIQRFDESASEVARIRNMGVTWDAVDFLEARSLMVQNRWLDAIGILQRVNLNPREDAELASSVYQQLGQCYEQIGHHHLRLKAYRDAVAANPHSTEAQLGLASALARMGRTEEALVIYRQFRGHPESSLAVAGLSLLKQILLPKAERTWGEVESALGQAIRDKASPDKTLRLKVMVLVTQGQLEPARRLLQQERKRRPDALAVWLLSAEFENRAGDAKLAEEYLKSAQQRLGQSVELKLAQLRLQSERTESNNAEWVFNQLERWDDLPENYRVPALNQLADGLEQTAQTPDEALKVRLELAAQKPDDLRIWRRILPLALAAKDDETAQKAVAEIRRIEGDIGPYWRLAETDRCLALARRGQTEFDEKAQILLKALINEMPADWTIPLRLAEIAERQGDSSAAIEHYKAILHLEVYPPQVVKRLVMLLSSKGRDSEAEGYLKKLQESQPRSFGARFGRIASLVALRSDHQLRALELARDAVKTDSKNPSDHLWLGQILRTLGMNQEAEQALRKSLALDPEQTSPRVALVRLLEEQDRHEEAVQEIAAIKKHVPEKAARLPVAYCLELTGQPDAAYQSYQQLVKDEPDNGYLRWVLAEFCLRSQRGEQAESMLRSLLASPKKWKDTPVAGVRRTLVKHLLQKPGYPNNAEALSLIESSLEQNPNSLPDLRLKAHLLSGRAFRSDRLKALAVFDQLGELGTLSKEDQIQRIQLLQSLNRKTSVREGIAKLMSAYQDDPNVLRFGLAFLLEWEDVSQITRGWLARLEEKAPEAYSTIELRARYLVAAGETAQAIQWLDDWRNRPPKNPEPPLARLEQIVPTLIRLTEQQDRLGRAQSTDQLATATGRLLAELIQQQPERIVWQIRYLISRWQLDDAWQSIEPAWKTAPAAEVAAVLVTLIQKSREDQRDYARVKDALENALRKVPDDLGLLMSSATIAQLCGEYDLAIERYRAAVQKNPRLVTARNELAVLYSLQGKPADLDMALKWIDQAIQEAGPHHFLLDTKACVLLAQNRPHLAIDLLTQAIADTPSPAKYFHLMQAHLQSEEPQKARRIYHTAMTAGFNISALHPLEVAAAREVIADLTN